MCFKKKNKSPRPANRRHHILDHPVLSVFLLDLLYIVLSGVVQVALAPSSGSMEEMTDFSSAVQASLNENPLLYLAQILAAVLMLLLFKFWFRKDKNHFTFKVEQGKIREGFLLGLPLLTTAVLNLVGGELVNSPKMIAFALLMGFTPGLCEEVTNRILPVANFMRLWRDPKKIPAVITITGAVFGLIHLTNLLVGADPVLTILQVLFAFGAGALFAAVYLRTGSMLGIVFYHTVIDFTAFLNASLYQTGGVMTAAAETVTWEIVLFELGRGLLFAAFAYFYVRPKKRAEILRVWDAKWNRTAADDEPELSEDEPILAGASSAEPAGACTKPVKTAESVIDAASAEPENGAACVETAGPVAAPASAETKNPEQ